MKYFFILGNNPTLSAAEISAVFSRATTNYKLPTTNYLILDTDKLDAKHLISKLGGTIKIGVIDKEVKSLNPEEIESLLPEKAEGKFKFGFSFYGTGKVNLKVLGMETKNFLKERGISARWVTSREPNLSSVVVEQNKLTDRGLEIVILKDNAQIYLGHTEAVQPFKDLSFRDFGRPARDDYSGMLPPKLAQIMINLSQAKPDDIILDPFCGSGTILTEALLMGFKNLLGSDISEKAISDTRKNIDWIQKNYTPTLSRVEGLNPIRYTLKQIDAQKLSAHFKPNSINAIITETYLGPQRGRVDLVKTKRELESLYEKSLGEMHKILKVGGRAVVALPLFKTPKGDIMLDRKIFSKFNIKTITPNQERRDKNALSQLVYGRPDQKVWREIAILQKN